MTDTYLFTSESVSEGVLSRWLKADGRMLSETGGLSLVLADQSVRPVAASEGDHGWWRGRRSD